MGSSKTYCLMSILCLIHHTGGKVPQILDRRQFSKFWSPPVFWPFLNISPAKYLQEQFPTLLLRWCRPWCFIPASCYWCPLLLGISQLSPRVYSGNVELCSYNWIDIICQGEICSRNFSPGFFSAEVRQHNAHRPAPAQRHRVTSNFLKYCYSLVPFHPYYYYPY